MITFKLAMSYIKKQKGKTVALLSSISLAVILIFSMTVIKESGYDSQIKEAKDLYGDYNVWLENIDKEKVLELEKSKEIKSLSKVKYFCKMIDKSSGVKMDFNSFDKDFINSLNYKLIGRVPQKEGEIVIEKEAINQMNIKNPLNKSIDLMATNKYVDENGINQVQSNNKTFKIVGVIEKNQKYYDSTSSSIAGATIQVFGYEDERLPINIMDTYKGAILLKSENNTNDFINEMQKKLDISRKNIYENTEVSSVNLIKMISKREGNTQKMILLVIVSSLVIYNIFNIILKDMINQIGLIRAIGMSKKKIIKLFIILSSIYILLGTILGILLGIMFSYIGLRVVYGYSEILTISGTSIIYSFVVSILSVSVSSFIVFKKAIGMSIIDSIKSSEKYEKKSKDKVKKASNKQINIIKNIAFKNIWRNKVRTIITMLAITIVGTMFIYNLGAKSIVNDNIEKGINGGIWGMSYGTVDKTISGAYNSTDSLFYKVDKNLVKDIKDIDGVESVEPNLFNPDGYIILPKNKITKSYQDELNRVGTLFKDEKNNEYPLLLRGYSDDMLKSRESFIQEGQNLINNHEGKYKKVILVNNTYSGDTHSFKAKVIDKAKVGDIIEIKLPVYKGGIKKYETAKVEVSAIMKEIYAASQDGNVEANGGQVIFREDDYKELTGQREYNKAYIMIKEGKLYSVEKQLEKLTKNHSFTSIGGKGEDQKMVGKAQNSEDRLGVIYQCLILLILSINSIFIMRSNIIARSKEIATLRAIGMSIKYIKKTLIIESQFYGLVATLIGSIIASINQYIGISNANKALIAGSFERTMEYKIPWDQILILFAVFIVIGWVSVYLSKDKIEGASITEGISQSE